MVWTVRLEASARAVESGEIVDIQAQRVGRDAKKPQEETEIGTLEDTGG